MTADNHLKVATYALTLILGALGFFAYGEYGRAAEAIVKTKKLEADLRTATGKFLDLQEKNNDEVDTVKTSYEVKMYELGQKYDACMLAGTKK